MVQPISPTITAPLAYQGGITPKSKPGFGAELSAMLGQVQATQSGLQALGTTLTHGANAAHPHHGHHATHRAQATSPPWQSKSAGLSPAHAGLSLTT